MPPFDRLVVEGAAWPDNRLGEEEAWALDCRQQFFEDSSPLSERLAEQFSAAAKEHIEDDVPHRTKAARVTNLV
jgi:hypothetical protein